MSERIPKISRILSTYHLFLTTSEVEIPMLARSFSVSEKTVHRDIRALCDAGVLRVRFDKAAGTDHKGAYRRTNKQLFPIALAEGELGRKFLVRIRRLCVIMEALRQERVETPPELYHALFPETSTRTRQRDFNELRVIGYKIIYKADDLNPPGHREPPWFVEVPGAFELTTIPRGAL